MYVYIGNEPLFITMLVGRMIYVCSSKTHPFIIIKQINHPPVKENNTVENIR